MEVKGVAVKTIPKYISLKYPEIYDAWMTELDPEVRRHFIGSIYASRWYDADKFVREPVIKAASIAYIAPEDLAWDMGEFSAEDALNGIYRFFLRFGGPVNMIKQTPFFLENYYKPSNVRLEVLDEDKKYAELVFYDFLAANDVVMYRIAGWGHYTLLVSGAKEANFRLEPAGHKDSKLIIEWA